MPSAVFPTRTDTTRPLTVSGITVPAGRRQITDTGIIQTRSSMRVGREWTETYPPLFAGKVEVEAFMSWVRWAWSTQTPFTITHLTTPGSGMAPNGTGSAGVTIAASQTGAGPITTNGWPSSTSNVVRAGDLLKVAGLGYTLEVTDDANSSGTSASIYVNPPIWVAPSGGAAITTTSVPITAIVKEANIPSIDNAFYYSGLTIVFREAP